MAQRARIACAALLLASTPTCEMGNAYSRAATATMLMMIACVIRATRRAGSAQDLAAPSASLARLTHAVARRAHLQYMRSLMGRAARIAVPTANMPTRVACAARATVLAKFATGLAQAVASTLRNSRHSSIRIVHLVPFVPGRAAFCHVVSAITPSRPPRVASAWRVTISTVTFASRSTRRHASRVAITGFIRCCSEAHASRRMCAALGPIMRQVGHALRATPRVKAAMDLTRRAASLATPTAACPSLTAASAWPLAPRALLRTQATANRVTARVRPAALRWMRALAPHARHTPAPLSCSAAFAPHFARPANLARRRRGGANRVIRAVWSAQASDSAPYARLACSCATVYACTWRRRLSRAVLMRSMSFCKFPRKRERKLLMATSTLAILSAVSA